MSRCKLELAGPGDLRIARDFTIGVRPAQAYQLRRFVGRLEPGQSVTLDDGAADEFLPGTAEALLTVSPRPDWDVPGLLRALDRYAYGCLEQTTSRAMPLLYVDAVARLWRTDPGFSPAETLDRAIGHIVELQRSDGSFGVWSDSDDTVPWLDAYATDFLIRAKEHGKTRAGFRDQGGARLAARLCPAGAYRDRGPAGGGLCALRAGAGARPAMLPALRYFTDTQLGDAADPARQGAARRGAGAIRRHGAGRLPPMTPRSARRRRGRPGCAMSITAANCATAPRCWPLPPAIPAMQPRLTAVDGPRRRAVRRAPPHQHAGAGLAADGGRGGGARRAAATMTVATGDARAADARRAALSAPPARLRRRAGDGRQSRRRRRPGARCRSPACRRPICRPRAAAIACPATVYRPRRHGGRSVRRCGRPICSSSSSRAAATDAARAARTLVVDLLPAGFEIETRDRLSKRPVDAGLCLAQGARPKRPIPSRATTAMSARSTSRRRQGFHARLCRARRHAGRIQVPGARRRGHVRARDRRPHRDRQARGTPQ